MAEQLNNNFLVVDTRLHSSNKIPYPVYQSGQSITTQRFSANSKSANNINFNVQVPSENVVMDRRAMIDATLQFLVTAPAGAFTTGARFQNYVARCVSTGSEGGVVDALTGIGDNVLSLSAFPLHTLMNSSVAQINNVSVTQNSSDILDTIERCLTLEDLSYNSESASLPDYYNNYDNKPNEDPIVPANSKNVKAQRVLGNYNDLTFKPNIFGHNSVLQYSFENATATSLLMNVKVREPLLMSPFVYDSKTHEGLSQLQNIILNFNLNPASKRVYRKSNIVTTTGGVANTCAISDIVLNNVPEAYVTFTFLTPKPSEIPQSARTVVPYYEIRSNTKGPVTVGDVTSDSYQLPMIPNLVLIYAKIKTNNGISLVSDFNGCNYGETYARIDKISINFNNNAGLLSSCQPKDLYDLSRRNCNLTSQEWLDNNYVGSFLALKMGQDIQISDQSLAPGSLGSFNFQYNISLSNITGVAQTYDLYTVFVYTGAFVSERGQSSTYLGLLDKNQVMEASKLRPVKRGELENLMGSGRSGGFLGMLASLIPAAISGLSGLFHRGEGSGMSGGASKVQSILDKYSM